MTPAMGVPSGTARALGYGGLLPFMALAASLWWSPGAHGLLASALLAYGACIATFVGAIAWGVTMQNPAGANGRVLAWGVTPSLVAWVAMLLPAAQGLGVLCVLLWACYAVDHRLYPRMGLGAWLPMRLQLTAVASVCCVAGAWRMAGVVA